MRKPTSGSKQYGRKGASDGGRAKDGIKKVHNNSGPVKTTVTRKKEVDIEKLQTAAHATKNPIIRRQLVADLKEEKKKQKSAFRRMRREAEQRGEPVEREIPLTIETMAEKDETVGAKDDEEICEIQTADEFQPYFDGLYVPKLMVTTCENPCKDILKLVQEFTLVVPNCTFYNRLRTDIKDIVQVAKDEGFSDIILFNEKQKKPFGVYVTHLPEGPTSYFRLTSLTLAQNIKGGAAMTTHQPEVILRSFDTRLGLRLSRQISCLFPLQPEFVGRRLIYFQNQRDFIFFRHMRYIFTANGTKTRLQEIGPRFTLKLRFIIEGTLDTEEGEYEFLWRPKMQESRKKFFV